MALNKQRILDELGSVINQLQGADCGCMGKLFSNSNPSGQATMGSPLPTCGGYRRGCCHGHGCNPYNNPSPSAGEPYSMNSSMHPSNLSRPCMGHCNPPKLYGETYNYLNKNLMQPVVQEVYNDLKNITPENTVMNNPLATQMGLNRGNIGGNPGLTMVQSNDISGRVMPNMNGMDGTSNINSMSMNQIQTPINNVGGMGPQIVNMLTSGTEQRNVQQKPGQGEPTINNAPHSQNQMGVASFNTPNNSIGQYNSDDTKIHSFNQNPAMYYTKQPNTNAYAQSGTMHLQKNSTQNHVPSGNMPLGNARLATQQKTNSNPRPYGQHTQGITKFNEMFPGVMQGDDLGFDPMAIAIQMNPANQQKVAMDTMNKFLNNTPIKRVTDSTNSNQPHNILNAQLQQGSVSSGEKLSEHYNVHTNQIASQQMVPGQQQLINTAIIQPQQQVYNTEIEEMHATLSENDGIRDLSEPNQHIMQPENIGKEALLPVDTSKNLHVPSMIPRSQYNTLGQPVEMLPSHLYHLQEPILPQTLSPQPMSTKLQNDSAKYINVKSTVSKTSLIGNKPNGRTPSRSQLQHIYNKYKGSQSLTQQNLKHSVNGDTFSEGNLNIVQSNVKAARAPFENIVGDTVANNQVNDDRTMNKVEQIMGQVGDVPMPNKPQGGNDLIKPSSAIPSRQANCRNGLQDVLYTSYPSSAAWSFHGAHTFCPPSVRYDFRK